MPTEGNQRLHDSERKQMVAIRLHPRLIAYLRASGSVTGTIERAVERTKAYREWVAANDTSGR